MYNVNVRHPSFLFFTTLSNLKQYGTFLLKNMFHICLCLLYILIILFKIYCNLLFLCRQPLPWFLLTTWCWRRFSTCTCSSFKYLLSRIIRVSVWTNVPLKDSNSELNLSAYKTAKYHVKIDYYFIQAKFVYIRNFVPAQETMTENVIIKAKL